jgi:hypothetical protein
MYTVLCVNQTSTQLEGKNSFERLRNGEGVQVDEPIEGWRNSEFFTSSSFGRQRLDNTT